MTAPVIWQTLMLAEAYLEKHPLESERLLLCGVKGLREHDQYTEVRKRGGSVEIAEPWEANGKYAKAHYPEAVVYGWTAQEYRVQCHTRERWPDAVLWLQGPEHATRTEALDTLNDYRDHGAKVIAEMPHGIHIQGADGGNPHEEHIGHLHPADFDPKKWIVILSFDDTAREDLERPHDVRHMLVVSR